MTHPSRLGFGGAYLDAVTGSYPLGNGYRFYLPSLFRFNVPDSLSPFGAGGVNPYSYCSADPINHVDPSGHVMLPRVEAEIIQQLGELVHDDMATDLAISAAEAGYVKGIKFVHNAKPQREYRVQTIPPVRDVELSRPRHMDLGAYSVIDHLHFAYDHATVVDTAIFHLNTNRAQLEVSHGIEGEPRVDWPALPDGRAWTPAEKEVALQPQREKYLTAVREQHELAQYSLSAAQLHLKIALHYYDANDDKDGAIADYMSGLQSRLPEARRRLEALP